MSGAADTLVMSQDSRGVARLRLNRPEVHNAFDDKLIGRLCKALEQLAADPALRVLILTGTGKSFCAGGDLTWMRDIARAGNRANQDDADLLARMLALLNDFPRPVIGRINGSAYGGGVGLISACDIALGVAGAGFSLSEVRLGLLPAVISPYVVSAIGARQARRYVLSGERIDAGRARELGLLHEVVEADALDGAVEAMTTQLLKGGPHAQGAGKQLIDTVSYNEQAARTRLAENTAQLIARLRASEEGQEGLSAFLQKRPPAWTR